MMANPQNGEVSLLVGDKAFTLKLTHNAAAEAEPYMNRSIFDIENGGISEVRALLFAMCKGSQGINTIEDAGDLLEEDPVACNTAVNSAVESFFQKYTKSQ